MTGYPAGLEYLYSLEKSGIVFGLDNITWLLGLLGHPEKSFKSIHVAGTNGKGSVVRMLSGILEHTPYCTGMYTSPHLVNFNERICVKGNKISDIEVAELTDRMRTLINDIDAENRRTLSFFDFTTAMAFQYFKERNVEWAVIEVGLGGRLDSTNVIDPAVGIITNVDIDHVEYLGDNIAQIASEKAGIIKDGIPVVTAACGEALEVIRHTAHKRKGRVYVLGEDFSYEKLADRRMSYRGQRWNLEALHVGLQGDHQLSNAALALCAAELLPLSGSELPPGKIEKALLSVTWPGRLEIAAYDPIVLLDGAHNPHGVGSLAAFLMTHYSEKHKILIFGALRDKDWKAMLELLSPLVDEIILTQPGAERALPSELLASHVPHATSMATVADALMTARERARKEDVIIVTGSLYTIGEARIAIDETA